MVVAGTKGANENGQDVEKTFLFLETRSKQSLQLNHLHTTDTSMRTHTFLSLFDSVPRQRSECGWVSQQHTIGAALYSCLRASDAEATKSKLLGRLVPACGCVCRREKMLRGKRG